MICDTMVIIRLVVVVMVVVVVVVMTLNYEWEWLSILKMEVVLWGVLHGAIVL